jgi:hypothetical protein
MKNLICPISSLKLNEHVVRVTALWVVILIGVTLACPNYYIPLYLVIDFYIRAFTKARFSPLSWISYQFVKILKTKPVLTNKAPKIFAARMGLLLTALLSLSIIIGLENATTSIGAILIIFASLECMINFCAGCWIYTYLILPIYGNK